IVSLIERCHILKMNNDELGLVADWVGIGKHPEDDQLAGILRAFPQISEILLTKGAEGARYYSREENISVAAPNITPIDTVGSGDSFLAAFLAQKIKGKTTAEALQWAVRISAY